MKKFILSAIALFFVNSLLAQPWMDAVNQKKTGEATFYEIQEEFYKYWSGKDIQNGYYIEDGEKKKAGGWKQFKRWEWYWEIRVDPKTGEFPLVSPYRIFKQYSEQIPKSSKNEQPEWKNLGTSTSESGYHGIGRINAVGFHPDDASVFWVGSPSGGLWKTENGGDTWTVQNDDLPLIGVSDIVATKDYSSTKTLFIATGDRDAWDNQSIGVLKSTDGGNTWNESLSFDVGNYKLTTRLLLHPDDDNTLFASTNEGVYKTENRGDSWDKISGVSLIDLEFKPGNPDIMYGSTNGNPTKIYKTVNGGVNWVEVLSVSGNRTEIAVTPNKPEKVYAVVSNTSSGLAGIYRSEDGGGSFTEVYDSKNLLGWASDGSDNGGQGWYDLTIAADPNYGDTLYVGGVNTWRSTNAGNSWHIVNHWWGDGVPAVHADKHYMGFQHETSLLFEGNDGGIYKTSDFGNSWTDMTDGMVISQIYRCATAQSDSEVVINGLQDNGTKLYYQNEWYDVQGGDGMDCMIDFTNAETQYGTLPRGTVTRTRDYWNSSTTIISNDTMSGAWVTPIEMHPTNNNTIYAGYSNLQMSTNQGDDWTIISSMNSGDLLRSIAVSEQDPYTIYTADRYHIWKTEDNGESWTEVTNNLPVSSNNITSITIKSDDRNTVWVTLGNYNNQNVYETTDGGGTWTNISDGLPQLPALDIVENKYNTDAQELYLGMDVGVYRRIDDGSWELYSKGLPNVIVNDLDIYYDKSEPEKSRLRAATYGRGLWELDLDVGHVVTNPENIGTTVKTDTVKVEWQYNLNNDSVLLAYSSEDIFGEPDPDIDYAVGEELQGGGEIIYFGNTENSFTHTSLESNTQYYFKIWSFDGTKYSKGVSFTATTSCNAPSVQASNINFENITDSSVTVKWQRGDGDNVLIIANNSREVDYTPVSGESYTAYDTYAEGDNYNYGNYVVYNGSGTEVNIDGLARETTYYFKLFEFNEEDSCYLVPGIQESVKTNYASGLNGTDNQSVQVYPNPVENNLIIQSNGFSDDVIITISDISGKTVYEEQVYSFGREIISMDKIKQGVYILKLQGENNTFVEKLLVK